MDTTAMAVTTPMLETIISLGLDGLTDEEFEAWSGYVWALPDEVPTEELDLLCVFARILTRQARSRRERFGGSWIGANRMGLRAALGIESPVSYAY